MCPQIAVMFFYDGYMYDLVQQSCGAELRASLLLQTQLVAFVAFYATFQRRCILQRRPGNTGRASCGGALHRSTAGAVLRHVQRNGFARIGMLACRIDHRILQKMGRQRTSELQHGAAYHNVFLVLARGVAATSSSPGSLGRRSTKGGIAP